VVARLLRLFCACALGISPSAFAYYQGSTSTDKPFDSVVELDMENDKGPSKCSAVVISSDTALTAAHCLEIPPTDAMLFFYAKNGAHAGSRKILKWKSHPDFKSTAFLLSLVAKGLDTRGDIAVLTFGGGLPDGTTVLTLNGNGNLLQNK